MNKTELKNVLELYQFRLRESEVFLNKNNMLKKVFKNLYP